MKVNYMLKTYEVLGREVQADPDARYIKPSNVTDKKLIMGHAEFSQFNVESFLASIRDMPKELHEDFYTGIELQLMECKAVLGFIGATQGDYEAEIVVMDGPVEFPNPKRTQELKTGLKNTIGLFEQLQRYRK